MTKSCTLSAKNVIFKVLQVSYDLESNIWAPVLLQLQNIKIKQKINEDSVICAG